MELAESTLASGLLIVAHEGGHCLAWGLRPGAAAKIVLIDPRLAAFVAQQSADAPAACGDLVNQEALAGGFGLEVVEEGVEERVEFLGASGTVEDRVDDVG